MKSTTTEYISAGSLEKTKEIEERIKQQYSESQHREKVLVRRLAAKEQEIQDYVVSTYFKYLFK